MYKIPFPILAIVLAGCASPQDKAISLYCNNEGLAKFPQIWITSMQETALKVGQRVVGTRQICETDVSKKVEKNHTNEISVRTCRNEDVVEPIYEKRNVPVTLDSNEVPRANFVGQCFANSKSAGMYGDLK